MGNRRRSLRFEKMILFPLPVYHIGSRHLHRQEGIGEGTHKSLRCSGDTPDARSESRMTCGSRFGRDSVTYTELQLRRLGIHVLSGDSPGRNAARDKIAHNGSKRLDKKGLALDALFHDLLR